MRTTLRRIDPGSLAKVYAAVYGAIALLFALPIGCAFSVIGSSGEMGALGAGIGLVAIIAYPVAGVIGGFIAGFLTAFVYNLVADRIGGVEIELDDLDEMGVF
ncbi:hypothetical protein [Rubrivirga sp. IMCC43871]|uniref:hypothetical protein n=1 Tax=Rubrivirga sp. IMCC43871 TaxID=3391575 RepID=UPI00398FDE21